MRLIETNIQQIVALCRKHKVNKLFAFGSILTNRFNEQSDVDLLVNFDENIALLDYADNYFDFKFSLEDMFRRKVDLVCDNSVNNPYFRAELDATKQLIYG